jgi:hypothetical protein
MFETQIDEMVLDTNFTSGTTPSTLEQIKKQIENFNNSSKVWDTLEFTYGELMPYYEMIPFRDVINGVRKTNPITIFLPSKGQRGKKSPIRSNEINEDFESSTWDYNSISDGMISWITQTSVPTIKVNTSTYEKYGVVGFWDGESKFQLKWRWFTFPTSKVWKVLDEKGDFNEVENKFVNLSFRWNNERNDIIRENLTDALKLFKTNFQNTKEQFLTPQWLRDNGYSELLDTILKFKPIVSLERKSDACESESYHREGARGAKQTPVNLVMTVVKDAWYDSVVYDNTKNPRDVHKPAINSACFAKKTSKNPFFRNIHDNVWGNEYGELDVYIYHFLSTCLIKIDNSSIKTGYFADFDNTIYNGIARPFDRGTTLVQNLASDYIEFLDKKVQNKKELNNQFKKVFNMVETILGYNRTKSENKVGLNNLSVIKNWTEITNTETQKLRNLLKTIGIDKPGNLGYLNKLRIQQKEIIYPIILRTLGYVLENPNLSETHITDVLKKVIYIVGDEWINYAWNFPIVLDDNRKNVFKFDYTDENWEDVIRGSENISKFSDPTFGPLYHICGGNIEKIYAVFDNFYFDVIKPKLDNDYEDASTTSKQRNNFFRYLRSKLGTNDLSNFKLFNTREDVLYSIEKFDIGHLEANSNGGVLRDKMWIFEFNKDNRHTFKLNQKSFELFWKEMIANCNDNVKKKRIEWFEDEDNEEKENDYNNAKKAQENLKIVLSYFEIEYDNSYSFKSGNVVLDSYVTELENN